MVASVAIPKEVIFATAWVSDGSTSMYQATHVSNTPTNSKKAFLCLTRVWLLGQFTKLRNSLEAELSRDRRSQTVR